MRTDLRISVVDLEGGVTLTVAGEIDIATSAQLTRALDRALDRDPPPAQIRIDLGSVGFMDTSGVAAVLAARKRAEHHGSRLNVSATSPFLDRLFAVTGIGRVLVEERASDDAQDSASPRPAS